MLTVVLALLAATGYSGADFSAGLAARRADVVRVTFVAESISCVLLVAAVPFISSQSPSPSALAWGAVAGASGAVAAMALYLGFRYAAFSVVSFGQRSRIGGVLGGSGTAPRRAARRGLARGNRARTARHSGRLSKHRPAAPRRRNHRTQPAAPASTTDPASTTSTVSTTDPASATYPTNAADPISNTNSRQHNGPHQHTDTVSTTDLASVAGRRPRHRPACGGRGVRRGRRGRLRIVLPRPEPGWLGSDLWPLASASVAGVSVVFCAAVAMRQVDLRPAEASDSAVLSGVASAGGTYRVLPRHAPRSASHYRRDHLALPGRNDPARPPAASERLTRIRIAGLCLAAVSIGLIAAASAR